MSKKTVKTASQGKVFRSMKEWEDHFLPDSMKSGKDEKGVTWFILKDNSDRLSISPAGDREVKHRTVA